MCWNVPNPKLLEIFTVLKFKKWNKDPCCEHYENWTKNKNNKKINVDEESSILPNTDKLQPMKTVNTYMPGQETISINFPQYLIK